MPMLDEVDFDHEPVQVMVYGPPKSGKTELVGKLAHDYDVIWIDGEKGGQTLAKLPPALRARINYFRVVDTPQNPTYIETALKLMTGAAVKICHEHGRVTCGQCLQKNKPMSTLELGALPPNTVVVWDSLTQMTASAFFKTAKAGDVDVEVFKDKFEFDHWGYQGALLNKFLCMIQGATWSNAVISHEAVIELEDKSEKTLPAGGTRNQTRNVARFFGHVVYIQVENLQHTGLSSTTGKNKVMAGSRTDVKIDMKAANPLLPMFKTSAAKAVATAPTQTTSVAGNAVAAALAAKAAANKTS